VIRHREGSRRDEGRAPSSLPDLAVSLRRARTRQGLRVEDVSGRTGIPAGQLEALESGTADRLADQIVTVRALRRYADFLGLPGDQFALLLVELWPVAGRPGPIAPAAPAYADAGVGGPTVVTVLPAAAAAPPAYGGTAAAVTGVVGTPPAPAFPDDTAGVPAVPGGFTPAPVPEGVRYVTGSAPAYTAQVPAFVADTGQTPVVPGNRADGRSRSRRGVTFLQLLVGVVGVLLILGLAGLAINHWRPQLLRTLHLPHSAIAPSTTSTTSSVTHPTAAPAPSVFTVTSSSPVAATATVRTPSFTLAVIPVGGPSWVQVSDASHPTPIFSQVVPALQGETFPNETTVTVQVGSSAARIFIKVDNKVVGYFFPSTAPFTVTVKAVS
jgi:cytoskeletal protein RodZ